ncbi:MAG: hypothetical protein QM734_06305 [Cyclobacteriaceae bacterium]
MDSSLIKPLSFSSSVGEVISLAKNNSILAIEKNGRIVRWLNQNDKWQSEELVNRSGVQIISASINKNESTLALKAKSGKKNIQIEIYDLNNLKNAKTIVNFDSDIESILVKPDGKGFYALTSSRKSIVFCDLINTKNIITSSDVINMIDISGDGETIAGIGTKGRVYFWDTKNYLPSEFQIEKESELTSLTFTPKFKDLVVGNSLGQLKILTNGIIRRVLQFHHAPVDQIVFSHNGRFLASLDRNKKILIWNWASLNMRPLEIQENVGIGNIAFSQDDNHLMTSSKTVCYWPLNMSSFAAKLCERIDRNMTKEEWEQYIGDIPYQKTCQ